jgi:Fibronectin type III domain
VHFIGRIVAAVFVLFVLPGPLARSASPPESATLLSAATAVTLRWTAPGDDGMSGRATAYQLRYSMAPITEASFDAATPVAGVPAPGLPGSTETFMVSGLLPNRMYYFAVKTLDEAGNRSALSNVVVYPTAPPTAVGDSPASLSFSPPWPNPARSELRCAYALPRAAAIQVDAFGVDGRHVRRLASGWHPAGQGEVAWDLRDERGRPVPAGVYFGRARLGDATWTRRALVAR